MKATIVATLMALSNAIQITADKSPRDIFKKEFVVFMNKNLDLNGDGVLSPEELEIFRTEMDEMEGMGPREKFDAYTRYGSKDGEARWFLETRDLLDAGIHPGEGGVQFEFF